MCADPYSNPIISQWVSENERISELVKFECAGDDQGKLEQYKANKEKYLTNLLSTRKNLEIMKQQVIESIAEVTDAPYMKLGPVIFDQQSQNMDMRKLVFLNRKMQSMSLKTSNETLSNIIEKCEDIEKLHKLLSSDTIPSDITIKIDETFFMYSISRKQQKLTFRYSALQNHYNKLEEQTKEYQMPKWYTNFPGFLHQVLAASVPHLDEALSYVPPLPCELPISRYCFSGISDYGAKIDELCKTIFDCPPPDFLKEVLDLGLALIPEPDTFTAAEQSVALLVFFRVIFDRLYELYPSFMFTKTQKEVVKMSDLSDLPCELFFLPKDSAPNHTEKLSMREAFQKDYYFGNATKFLESTMFCTNPIDDLYAIHRTLLCINKAALMQRMKEKVASFNDINQLLCFDDLFVLFLGCYLSSDLYEFMSVADFVSRFSPAFCLSNSFEYAQATLESLVTHINSVTPNILRERFRKMKEQGTTK